MHNCRLGALVCQRCPCSTHRASLIQIPAAHLLWVREVLLLARKWGRRLGPGASRASALLAAGAEAYVAPLVLFTRIHDLRCVGATRSSWMRSSAGSGAAPAVGTVTVHQRRCRLPGSGKCKRFLHMDPMQVSKRLVQKVVRRRQLRRRRRRVSRILRLVVFPTFRSTLERQRRGGPIHGSGSIVISCHLPAPCLREKNRGDEVRYGTSIILASIHPVHSISRARPVSEKPFELRGGRTPVGVRTWPRFLQF